jgi:hypothetical protein
VQFDATGSTGFRMSLAASANVNIAGNIILDTTDGGTGMLFDSVVGPGVFRIENNVLDFHDTGALTDRGIIFSSITNTIQLQGSGNNQVINADTPFFAPIGTTSGSIFVNGSPVP